MTYNLQNYNYCTVNKVITSFVSLYPMFDTAYQRLHPREPGSHALTGYPISDVTRSTSTDSQNDVCTPGSYPEPKITSLVRYLLELCEVILVCYHHACFSTIKYKYESWIYSIRFIRYHGGVQQIPHWQTWFPTAPRHGWIHLQPTQGQDYLRRLD